MPDVVALTFDDGPDPAGTPDVLAALAAAQARATFFVLGERAIEHPRSIAAIRAAGHEVELHGHRHLRHTEVTRAELAHDTEQALEALRRLGVTPRRWRTPWGVRAPWTVEVAVAHALELTDWDLDPEDWAGPSAEEMLGGLAPRLARGAIVLLHDGVGPGARRSSCIQTARLVGPLVAEIRARGWEPGPLGALPAAVAISTAAAV
ncbi:polysaccharide deacetylase family protein [Conexibacter sp. CPCC 206217]|uniref:polysaccharide deacetylase family protein n=1 Tax=Conexibacter sp. CPCC 206217 TaxID=3064574 RepID=UPI00271F2865|nr:polysaccharide deacetylase family protein [Conexibacter sp. CPCC 206217]MDO8209879.1 polysaccharide deacetylase family protein [Conexibacter sp. CPCC 206217]